MFALALLCTAQFMVILDITVVNVALPSIQGDLESRSTTSSGWSLRTRLPSAGCCSSEVEPPTCSVAVACS
jgi:hypothetical protein